jgi:hypothetical protein
MAIAVDQSTLGGDFTNDVSSTASIPFTTTNVVASGGFIVLLVTWHKGVTLSSVAGGSLTWTIDLQGASTASNGSVALVSAQAPSGLASSTTITATLSSASTGVQSICGTSFTGVKTSSPVDVTSALTDFTTTTAWTTASTTIAAGSVLVANAVQLTGGFTSTPTSPSIETHDQNAGVGSFSETSAYRIEAAGGAFTVAGTWSSSATGTAAGVAYLAAAAAPAGASFHPPRMPLGV